MNFLLDTHCDAPSLLLRGADFSRNVKQGFTPGSFPVTQVDFARMKKGGVNGSFFAIYSPNGLAPEVSAARALDMISKVYDAVERNSTKAALATSPVQARRNARNGLISIFMGMENGDQIGGDLARLNLFYRLGVRYMTLTHSGNNDICDSCGTAEKRWGGLSPFGEKVVARMNELGMLVDVSHISDDSFWDVLRVSKAPVVATHSCCRALSNHPRNMTDDMIKALAEKGGVISVNFYPCFLDAEYHKSADALIDAFGDADKAWRAEPENPALQKKLKEALEAMNAVPRPSYKNVVDHIDHVVSLVGIKHVGIGSDFDGIDVAPDGLKDVSMMQKVIIELRRRGYSDYDIKLISSGNFFRAMDAAKAI